MAKEKQTFEKYQTSQPDELSQGQLKFGKWWIKNRLFFRRLLIGILGLIGISGIGFGMYSVGHYFIVERPQAKAHQQHFLRPKVPFAAYHESLAPSDVRFESTVVLKGTDDLYDFVTKATNPNEDWYVTFNYKFQFDDRETEVHEAMLVPGKQTVLTDLGYETQRRPSAPSISIEDVRWFRISPHMAPDSIKFIEEHSALSVSNVEFIPGAQSEDAVKAHSAKFTLYNDTAFNFWEVPIYILMYQGSSLIAIEQTVAKELVSGQQQDFDVRSFKTQVRANNIEVVPYVAVFDWSIYMPQ